MTRLDDVRERAQFEVWCAWVYPLGGGKCGDPADHWVHTRQSWSGLHDFVPEPPTDLQLLVEVADAARVVAERWDYSVAWDGNVEVMREKLTALIGPDWSVPK